MNKKIFIPAIAAVALLPVMMYFGGIFPMDVTTYALSPAYDKQELVKKSDIIAYGTLVSSKAYVEWSMNGNIAVPSVYTVWTLQKSESLKGNTDKIIEFVVDGGEYNNIKQTIMYETELNERDDVLVFLSKETDSIYKDNYYITGLANGIFKIEDGVVKNSFMKTSENADSMKASLKSFN